MFSIFDILPLDSSYMKNVKLTKLVHGICQPFVRYFFAMKKSEDFLKPIKNILWRSASKCPKFFHHQIQM